MQVAIEKHKQQQQQQPQMCNIKWWWLPNEEANRNSNICFGPHQNQTKASTLNKNKNKKEKEYIEESFRNNMNNDNNNNMAQQWPSNYVAYWVDCLIHPLPLWSLSSH